MMGGATEPTTAKVEAAPPKERARGSGRTGPRPGSNGIAATIGQALQAHYDDLVAAPMPDRFLALLAELEAKEKSRG